MKTKARQCFSYSHGQANWFLTRVPRPLNGQRRVSLTNNAGTIGYLLAKVLFQLCSSPDTRPLHSDAQPPGSASVCVSFPVLLPGQTPNSELQSGRPGPAPLFGEVLAGHSLSSNTGGARLSPATGAWHVAFPSPATRDSFLHQ